MLWNIYWLRLKPERETISGERNPALVANSTMDISVYKRHLNMSGSFSALNGICIYDLLTEKLLLL